MKKRLKKGFLTILLLVAILLTVIAFGLLPVNLSFAKNSIKSMVQQQLGVDLEIRGPLTLRLGFSPELSASSVVLRISDNNGRPLASVQQLLVNPALFDIFQGFIHLRNVTASNVTINYCPDVITGFDSGAGNGAVPAIAVDHLKLIALQLECEQAEKAFAPMPQNIDLEFTTAQGNPIHVEISGQLADEEIDVIVTTTSLGELLSASKVIPFDMQWSGFNSSLQIDAEILKPFDSPSLEATLSFESQDPTSLLAVAGMDSVSAAPVEIKARLMTDLESVQVERLDVSLGDLGFRASGEVRGLTERPYFQINAQLPQLDAGLLTEEMSGSTTTDGSESVNLEPWLESLQSFDASLKIEIGKILNTPYLLNDIELSANLANGKLLIDEGSINVDKSRLSFNTSLDTTSGCPAMISEVQWANIQLQWLNQFLHLNDDLSGHVEAARAKLNSCGFNLDDHARSLSLTATISNTSLSIADFEYPLVIDSLAIETGYAEPGKVSVESVLMGENLSAELSFGTLSELLDSSSWPVSIRAKGAGSSLIIDGITGMTNDSPRFEGHLKLDIDRLGGLHDWAGFVASNQLPASGRANVMLDGELWSVSAIDIHLGRSNLRGALSLNGDKANAVLTAQLESELLDMNELSSLFPEDNTMKTGTSFERPTDLDRDEWLEDLLTMPPLDYKLSLAKIDGLNTTITDLQTEGRLRNKHIENALLAITYEDVEISGHLDADLRQNPWKLDYGVGASNVDIGRLLAKLDITQDVTAQADHVEFKIVSEGRSIAELARNVHLESRIESLRWTGQLQDGEGPADKLHLSTLEFVAAPSARADWIATGDFNGTPIKFSLQTPSLQEALNAKADFDVHLILNSGQDLAIVDAIIDRSREDQFKAELKLSGQRFDTREIALSNIIPPLNDYQLYTQLIADDDMLQLSDMELKLGSSEISGRLRIDLIDDQIKLATQLHSPRLETDDFISLAEQWRLVKKADVEEPDSNSEAAELPDGFASIVNGLFRQFAGENSLDIRFEIEQMYSAGELLGSGQFGLLADKDKIHIKPLSIISPGGNVEAGFYAGYTPQGVESRLNIHMEKLEYGGLLQLTNLESTGSGTLFMDTTLEATAPDWKQIPASVGGHLDLMVIPYDIKAGYLDLWASNLIFALLPTGKDEKKINCLAARFDVENGVMTSKNILMDSTEIIIRGRGSIDLAGRELDLLLIPQAKLEKFLSISAPIQVQGPIAKPKSSITSGGLLTTGLKWYMGLIYVPFKRLTGERFPTNGLSTCYKAMDWAMPQGQN